ncbi:hypothetical protein L2E82_10287 [Cichorium intybus]|uniref:Uncharacterized protein n=1 Tax=Cichorium intybus TaxID=13427 RepID=A0ACB9GB54_CICIN|nr:hypothetical protein L2E82_10287 [Cichorium intybus]
MYQFLEEGKWAKEAEIINLKERQAPWWEFFGLLFFPVLIQPNKDLSIFNFILNPTREKEKKEEKENKKEKKEENDKENEKEEENEKEGVQTHVTEGHTWLSNANDLAHFESLNMEGYDSLCYYCLFQQQLQETWHQGTDPLIEVAISLEQASLSDEYFVKQKLYLNVQFLLSGCQGGGQWVVPITLCCGSYEARKSFLLETKSKTIDTSSLFGHSISDNEPSSSLIKVNVDRVGFYRVKYDEQLSAKLRYAIESKSLSAMDRYEILDDSFALSMAGHSKVARIVADADNTLLDNIKMRIGFDPKKGESHLDALFIGELFATLAVFGHEDTLLEENKHFQAFLEDINTHLLPPDIRRAVYVAVMKKATATDRSDFDSLLKVYRETDLSQEKTQISVIPI